MKIPKKIHYCWFGNNKLPDLAKKCIESWQKYFPDYEIIEWNENNFDVNKCDYIKEAYNNKKWAFVSDYARFWILYHEGGIYFDTDVEVIKPMKDIIDKGPFFSKEKISDKISISDKVAPGLGMAAYPKMNFYKEMLDIYENEHFILDDGKINKKNIVTYTEEQLKKHDYIPSNNIIKIDDIYIYPADYFCPMNYKTGNLLVTDNTRTIHWYDASWFSKESKHLLKMERKFCKVLPRYISNIIFIVYKYFYLFIVYTKNGELLKKVKKKVFRK